MEQIFVVVKQQKSSQHGSVPSKAMFNVVVSIVEGG